MIAQDRNGKIIYSKLDDKEIRMFRILLDIELATYRKKIDDIMKTKLALDMVHPEDIPIW